MGTKIEFTPLSKPERAQLAKLEKVIENGRQVYRQVGAALAEIQASDPPLYREQGQTFEQYVKARWSMSRSYAYRMIDAAEVHKIIEGEASSIGDKITEGQARELVPFVDKPDELKAILDEASVNLEDGKLPTAKMLRDVASAHLPDRKPLPGKSTAKVKAPSVAVRSEFRDLVKRCTEEIDNIDAGKLTAVDWTEFERLYRAATELHNRKGSGS